MDNTLQIVLNFYQERGGETAWGQGHMAVDSEGYGVNSHHPTATRWCLLGAIYKLFPLKTLDMEKVYQELTDRIENNIVDWNDKSGRTWDDVETMLSKNDMRNII